MTWSLGTNSEKPWCSMADGVQTRIGTYVLAQVLGKSSYKIQVAISAWGRVLQRINYTSRMVTILYAIFGPNTSWSSYLVVGANTNDKTNAANNTAIAQCISTNGNLHLDAGHNRDIYMNHYSDVNYIYTFKVRVYRRTID